MKPNYRAFFALTRAPFGFDLAPREIMPLCRHKWHWCSSGVMTQRSV
ncbi:hypothetical protein DFAR_3380016 [Desulfarculales bacterium]